MSKIRLNESAKDRLERGRLHLPCSGRYADSFKGGEMQIARRKRPPGWPWIWAVAALCSHGLAMAACPPEAWSRTSIEALKQDDFRIAGAGTRASLAIGLIDCLDSPDPALRDGIAYEALQHWLREKTLSPEDRRALRTRLFAKLDAPDPLGVARPFAALVLSEIARSDRIEPWMRDAERSEMIGRAARYLRSIDDYRGFDAEAGWRHGVAHGADWAMQLTLNPALTRAQLDLLLDAVAAQAVPAAGHAYVFGEPERLARPLLFIAKRGLHSEAEWTAWFAALSMRVGDPALAWKDAAWLARRHDLAAFLQLLYVETDVSEDPGIARMRPGVLAALKALP
jgi:Protein of unknown function (DUF2785)